MIRNPLRLGILAVAALALAGPAVVGLAPVAGAAPGPSLQVKVSGAQLAPSGLQVTLSGTYSCGPFSAASDYGVVDLTLRQSSGGVTTTGYGYLFLTVCDGGTQTWSATVDSVGGPFVAGRAQVSGSGYACDPAGGPCAFDSFGPTTLRLRA